MAERIIEGVPGSGKTFYAVRHIAKSFFKKTKEGQYVLDKEVTLITNIDSFQPDHLCLQDEIKHAGGVANFFSYDYQEKYKEGKDPIIYIIDEAQRLFRKGQRGLEDVYTYFEYHRHWGQDIYLITQNVRKLPPDLVYLSEFIIVAAPRVRSLLGEFKYKWLSDGEVIKREGFKPDKGVFALYKSMEAGESEKISNPVMKTVGMVLVTTFCIIFVALWYFKKGMLPDEKNTVSSAPVPSTSPAVVPISGTSSVQDVERYLPELIYFIALNTAQSDDGLKSNVTVFWQRQMYSLGSFPYRTIYKGKRWYAVLKSSEFEALFSDNEDVRYFALEDSDSTTSEVLASSTQSKDVHNVAVAVR